MAKEGEWILIVLVIALLVLIMNPSLVGITAGSIVGESFSNVWSGLETSGQTIILFIVFLVVVVFLIGKKD